MLTGARLGRLGLSQQHVQGSLVLGLKSSTSLISGNGGQSRWIKTIGAATSAGTAKFLSRFPQIPTSTIPKRGTVVSKLGFGAYRINPENNGHRSALLKAFRSGVNVVDTSAHFGYGASESLIGDTLETLFSEGSVDRSEIVVISKAGFILVRNATNAPSILSSFPAQGVAQINQNSFHSIHPSFLKLQIEESLDRLKLDRLDIFMLNHPERMMGATNMLYGKKRLIQEIGQAFEFLDQMVEQGKIGGYGICSNALHVPTADDFVKLEEILETRLEFGWKKENFVAIEVPLNLFERDLVTDVFPEKSLARQAKDQNIFVFTNRPLNAIMDGKIVTLENKNRHDRTGSSTAILEALDKEFLYLAELELEIKDTPQVPESIGLKFIWSEILSENLARLSTNVFAARHFLDSQVMPAIDRDLASLQESIRTVGQQLTPEEELEKGAEHGELALDEDELAVVEQWQKDYRETVVKLMGTITKFCQLDTDTKNDELDLVLGLVCREFVTDIGEHRNIDDNEMDIDEQSEEKLQETTSLTAESDQEQTLIGSTLSAKSIQFSMAHESVGCVLVGMRQEQYVIDALAAAEASPQLGREELDMIVQCPLLLHTTPE